MKKAKFNFTPLIILALFALYLVLLFKITIFRNTNLAVHNVNLIPFVTITEYYHFILRGNSFMGFLNILGNIIIFMPFGYITALLFPYMRKPARILVWAAIISLVIEISQFIFACGATDIDDVILNTLGGLAGYWLYALMSGLPVLKKYTFYVSVLMIALTCLGFFTVNNYIYLLSAPGNSYAFAETQNYENDESFSIKHLSNAESLGKANDTAWCLIVVNTGKQ